MKSFIKPSWIALALSALPAISPGGEPFELESTAIENLQLEFSNAEPRPVGEAVRAPGVVRLNEKRVVEVAARIHGVVEEDLQTLGATVKKGDKLFKLESAELSEDITTYVDAEQAMAFAHTALDQEKKLFEKNLSSREQLQAKELAFQQAVAEHARALQPLKLLHFNEGTIHQYLNNVGAGNYTTLEVEAPEAGEVIEKSVRRGAAVEPEEMLYTIADLSELWVDFHVSLREVGQLREGMEVAVASSISDQQGTASISYVAPIADEASRTVLVRAVLKNEGRAWRPGTPVVVSVAGDGNAVLSVPVSALVDFEGGKAVFVRQDETGFAPTPVKVGRNDGKVAEVISGLEAGQSVVSRNAAQLKGHLEMTAEE